MFLAVKEMQGTLLLLLLLLLLLQSVLVVQQQAVAVRRPRKSTCRALALPTMLSWWHFSWWVKGVHTRRSSLRQLFSALVLAAFVL
jgi:hypothetical protein